MGIYERMAGAEAPRLQVHTFTSACGEIARGGINGTNAANRMNLTTAERQEATTLFNRVTGGQVTPQMTIDVLLLLEVGFYTVAEAKTRLGV